MIVRERCSSCVMIVRECCPSFVCVLWLVVGTGGLCKKNSRLSAVSASSWIALTSSFHRRGWLGLNLSHTQLRPNQWRGGSRQGRQGRA